MVTLLHPPLLRSDSRLGVRFVGNGVSGWSPSITMHTACILASNVFYCVVSMICDGECVLVGNSWEISPLGSF